MCVTHLLVSLCVCVCVCVQLSHSWGQPLGSVVLPLREVLAEPDLVLDRWLSLDGAQPESQILLRASLKVTSTPTGGKRVAVQKKISVETFKTMMSCAECHVMYSEHMMILLCVYPCS